MKNKFETARLPNQKVKGTTTALRPRTCAIFTMTIVGQIGERVFLKAF